MRPAALVPAGGQVEGDPAEPEVVAHHPAAGRPLEQVEDQLALLDRVEGRGEERPEVVQQEADRPHVAGDPGQLGHDDPDVLGPLRGLRVVAHQLLDGQGIAEVVAHAGQVVEPVGEREVHQERVPLADLLVVAVHVAHDRLQADDRLAVDPQVHAEDAVGARVLWPHADDELVGVQLGHVDADRGSGRCPWRRRPGRACPSP